MKTGETELVLKLTRVCNLDSIKTSWIFLFDFFDFIVYRNSEVIRNILSVVYQTFDLIYTPTYTIFSHAFRILIYISLQIYISQILLF